MYTTQRMHPSIIPVCTVYLAHDLARLLTAIQQQLLNNAIILDTRYRRTADWWLQRIC